MAADTEVSSAKKSRLLLLAKGLDGLNLVYIAMAAIVCLTSWGTIFYKHSFESSRIENRLNFCDFAKYYVCGKLALSPDSHSAYDGAVQADYTVRYAAGKPNIQEEFIHYPPMDFPLMAPLSTLPIEQSYLAFCLLGSALLLAGTYLLSRTGATFSPVGTSSAFSGAAAMLFYWLAIFGSVPMFRTFTLGQTSVFLTGVVAFYVFAMIKNRPVLGGVALAITSIKPQYTLFLAIPVLVQRRYKLIIYSAIFEIIMILAAVATIGLDNVINYPKILIHSEQTVELSGRFVSEMVNVRGLLASLLGDSLAVKGSAFLAVSAWIFLAFLWFKFGRSKKDLKEGTDSIDGTGKTDATGATGGEASATSKLLLAITVCYAITFSPHTHLYDCCFLAIPVLVAGRQSLTACLEEKSIAKKLFAALLIVYPFAGWWCFLCMPGSGVVHTASFAVYNLVLCGAATMALFKDPD